ncbi:MAG: glycosyltransferase family 9 protein [Gemmatimonadota bacterium]|nr:glycosyltransferase family 9 protein [Gemmatimonadota bacterium]
MSRVPLDRVCIVMMSAVGDVVHVLPVLTALKRHHPAMHVTWVLQPGPAELVRGHPMVDEIVLFERRAGLRGFLDLRRTLADRRFDLVINLQVYLKAGIITGMTDAPVKLGFDRARARDGNWLFTTHRIPPHPMQHVQDQYLEFCDWLEVPHHPVRWGLGPWDAAERDAQRAFLARFDRPIAPIVVATSKPEKDWIPERWAAVCDALWHDFGLQPVLVGARSPREVHAERVILDQSRAPVHSALGQGGLRGLVGILEGAALVLSPDTGPLHITVALDRPVVSLIAYSNPKRVGPYRKFGDLMIDAYGDPGEDYPISMENRPGRMPRITVRDVLDRVERWRTAYATDAARTTPRA